MEPIEAPVVVTNGIELALFALKFFSYLLLGSAIVGGICAGSGIGWLCRCAKRDSRF